MDDRVARDLVAMADAVAERAGRIGRAARALWWQHPGQHDGAEPEAVCLPCLLVQDLHSALYAIADRLVTIAAVPLPEAIPGTERMSAASWRHKASTALGAADVTVLLNLGMYKYRDLEMLELLGRGSPLLLRCRVHPMTAPCQGCHRCLLAALSADVTALTDRTVAAAEWWGLVPPRTNVKEC
jgi:hypothetical protein